MSLAVVRSRALDGLDAPEVQVEVHLANGLPSFTLVGLADTEVKEARERVRAALTHSGLGFPHNKRVTVNLAPADLPKESGRFDLPIALGILAAAGQVDAARLADVEFAGELSLAGELRPVRGAIALALGLRAAAPARTLVLPAASAAEAALVGGVGVRAASHLLDVVAALQPGDAAVPLPRAVAAPAAAARPAPDLRDVRGQAAAKRVLEIAAAGAHSVLMVGPPGSGKSMLAQRLPGLLPPMDDDEALRSAALQGLSAEGFDVRRWRQRPLRAPHHSASAVALVGGGSPPRPGEISLAHGGVLFLDELVEFNRSALEALREPLEAGRITISRAARQATFPARFQLVAAMNPCPCGWLGAPVASPRTCRCTPDVVARYQARLSGPLLDRIDLQVEVPAVAPAQLLAQPEGEPTAVVAARVAAARGRALARQGRANALLEAADLERHCRLDEAAQRFAQQAAQRLGWSGRSLHRVLKVARTIADLAGSERLTATHLAEAMQYRRALPAA
ncbi:YifB family Mg chelatase-like AAA ATPase [Calidifontimicrobium sp. SYSU G02091]|uniref:YifB family Mg chelatase-like AAA ATPase n=1 Tax=Calidifontimicrobium sp. SYSU G02091 TaxID=2926421 RepID=UPI001F52BDC9|nr:YifB family Mg chelatase-like AAA ATPase [Calidifontimicrobium sp. SYSU G02091]MCI1193083.1 YifB family Mg chelatase-like AAA ATPase [Calidifontimicrobium sp. SYSU G02091]